MGQVIGQLCKQKEEAVSENETGEIIKHLTKKPTLDNLEHTRQLQDLMINTEHTPHESRSTSPDERKGAGLEINIPPLVQTPHSVREHAASIVQMWNNHRIHEEDFVFHNLIGEGGFGKVYLAHIKGNEELLYALKVINKSKFAQNNFDSIMQELRVLSIISDHSCPFLTKLYCSFQSKQNLFFCLEFVPGGNLRSYLTRLGKFNTILATNVCAEVLLALAFMHEKLDIIHRDLKPENILIDENGHIKLTDFGLSKVGNLGARSFCGTFNYIAPELIKQQVYNKMVDFWMLGCILYEMLVGVPPFNHKNHKTLFDMINAGCYRLNQIQDPIAKDLVSKLLITTPNSRIGAGGIKEVMSHPFFQNINFKKLSQLEESSPLQPYVVVTTREEKITNLSRLASEEINSPRLLENFTYVPTNRDWTSRYSTIDLLLGK